MISILDYGVGNVQSLQKMIERIGHDVSIIQNLDGVKDQSIVFIPGVGSFDNAINKLNSLKIDEQLKSLVLNKKIFVVGICLGMHLMLKQSKEGNLNGLGFINEGTDCFADLDLELKTLHMGWNDVHFSESFNFFDDSKFYFCHSYFLRSIKHEYSAAKTDYGEKFVSFFWKDNILGIQFHPEKSGRNGMEFLKILIERINASK